MAEKMTTGPESGGDNQETEHETSSSGSRGIPEGSGAKQEDQPITTTMEQNGDAADKSESDIAKNNNDTKTDTVQDEAQEEDKQDDAIPNTEQVEAKAETTVLEEDESGEEVEHIDNPSLLERQQLFEKGLAFEEKGKEEFGLKCYLQSITGLESSNGFKDLPQCLHHIADIYYNKQEYEKAIQFIQAEKMYYETALVDFGALARQTEKRSKEINDNEEKDPKEEKPEAVRADEYENLAKMCLEQKQPHLALEYQGKASKMRQELFGDDHPITKKSLDFFTVIYGEVGKHQYAESMQRLDREPDNSSDSEHPAPSIMTRRKSDVERASRRASQQVRFQDIPETIPSTYSNESQVREQEEWIANALLIVLFFICMIALSCIMFYIYCRIDGDSKSCSAWKADVHYYYIRFKYWFYYYISPKAVG